MFFHQLVNVNKENSGIILPSLHGFGLKIRRFIINQCLIPIHISCKNS